MRVKNGLFYSYGAKMWVLLGMNEGKIFGGQGVKRFSEVYKYLNIHRVRAVGRVRRCTVGRGLTTGVAKSRLILL